MRIREYDVDSAAAACTRNIAALPLLLPRGPGMN
jgi:hypothetical protein